MCGTRWVNFLFSTPRFCRAGQWRAPLSRGESNHGSPTSMQEIQVKRSWRGTSWLKGKLTRVAHIDEEGATKLGNLFPQ